MWEMAGDGMGDNGNDGIGAGAQSFGEAITG